MRNKEMVKKKKKNAVETKKTNKKQIQGFEGNNESGIKQNHWNLALFRIAAQPTRTDSEFTSINEITQEEVKEEQKFTY